MKHFWASVLLKTGSYKGKPVPAHASLSQLKPEHFDQWMALFISVTGDLLPETAAEKVVTTAQRIAQSLWLAKFASPFDTPPAVFGLEKTD